MLFVKVVESEDGGVIISKLNDDAKECSSVFVGAVAWNLLARYQHDAAKALEKGTLGSWILQKNSDESALMLTVSPYNNRPWKGEEIQSTHKHGFFILVVD